MTEVASTLSAIVRRARPALEDADLEQKLQTAVAGARAAWPEVDIDDVTFATYLGERLPRGARSADVLDGVAVTELYLACGCVLGRASAFQRFERDYLAGVTPLIAKFDASADFIDEVRQQLRLRLLTGPTPRIGDYSGSGPLAGWVRVAVSRIALNQLRTMRRRERLVPPAPDQPDMPDPEKLLLDERFRALLEQAVRAAFAGLDADQRTLLRRYYVERESVEQIARSYGLERSTLSRRMSQLRRTLLEATGHELSRLVPGLTPASRDSLIMALRSRINITLGTVLNA